MSQPTNNKAEARQVIESLPDDVTFEDIHYHLYVREKVARGLRAIEEGRTLSQQQAEERVNGWLK